MTTLTIGTTIKGGLPVIARGRYEKGWAGSHIDPPEPDCIEDIEITFLNGNPVKFPISDDDYERVQEALLVAATTEGF